jgi:hypothetical protein
MLNLGKLSLAGDIRGEGKLNANWKDFESEHLDETTYWLGNSGQGRR